MGLTIHYTITPRQPIDATEARRLIYAACAATRRLVRRRGYSHVTRPKEADPEDIWLQGTILRKVDAYTTRSYSVPPRLGGYFELTLGQDCETALFGLCEYPATLRLPDGRRLRTGLGGWRFHACCKTQYASLHGWEPFFASHKLVIDAALVWQKLGCNVELIDEGNYWPGRKTEVLRTNLNQMNGLIAAMGGALKDANDEAGQSIDSPIFAHPRFEHLEAEGLSAHAPAIQQAVDGLTQK